MQAIDSESADVLDFSNEEQYEPNLENNLNQIDLIQVNNVMNIKDFCGSQELNLLVKKRPSQRVPSSTTKKLHDEEGDFASNQPPTMLNSKSVTNFFSPPNSNYLESSTSMHSFSDSKLKNLNQSSQHHKPDTFYLTAENSCTSSTTNDSASTSSISSSQDIGANFIGFESSRKNATASSQTSISAHQHENYYSSSLISDYRLTLTDLIDMNLIDATNGLIINPVNGMRLTVADAIRIDLLNSDVKEVANTFHKRYTSLIVHLKIKRDL